MRFFAEPNTYVKYSKNSKKIFGGHGFSFDANGVYETDNERLIKAMKPLFKYDGDTEKEEQAEERHCKKCGFSCCGKGELLNHYRKFHSGG